MFEADELCDRIAVIADGQVVAQGTPDELKQGVAGGHVIEVEVFGDATPALAGVRELRGVESVAVEVRGQAQVLVVHTDVGAEVASDVLGRLSGLRLGRVATREPTLEDAYIGLVTTR
jgi:ABC-2 type transport system ATP-binding protein